MSEKNWEASLICVSAVQVVRNLFAFLNREKYLNAFLIIYQIQPRNIKTQGITTAETSVIKPNGFCWFH